MCACMHVCRVQGVNNIEMGRTKGSKLKQESQHHDNSNNNNNVFSLSIRTFQQAQRGRKETNTRLSFVIFWIDSIPLMLIRVHIIGTDCPAKLAACAPRIISHFLERRSNNISTP